MSGSWPADVEWMYSGEFMLYLRAFIALFAEVLEEFHHPVDNNLHSQ